MVRGIGQVALGAGGSGQRSRSGNARPGKARLRASSYAVQPDPMRRSQRLERRRELARVAKLEGSVAALVGGKADEPTSAPAAGPRAQAVRASICVLPFVNMSGEPEQEYFSDGISEDITTDLSKVSALEVVARNTAFSFKGQNPRCEGGREAAERQPRAGRKRAQGWEPGADQRPADRRIDRQASVGRPLRPRPRRTFSKSRTKFRKRSSTRSRSSCCRRKRRRLRSAGHRTSKPTIYI